MSIQILSNKNVATPYTVENTTKFGLYAVETTLVEADEIAGRPDVLLEIAYSFRQGIDQACKVGILALYLPRQKVESPRKVGTQSLIQGLEVQRPSFCKRSHGVDLTRQRSETGIGPG
jgi:hypothetical protein